MGGRLLAFLALSGEVVLHCDVTVSPFLLSEVYSLANVENLFLVLTD